MQYACMQKKEKENSLLILVQREKQANELCIKKNDEANRRRWFC